MQLQDFLCISSILGAYGTHRLLFGHEVGENESNMTNNRGWADNQTDRQTDGRTIKPTDKQSVQTI